MRQIVLVLMVGGMIVWNQSDGAAQRPGPDRPRPRRDLSLPRHGTILGVFNPGSVSRESVQDLGARAVRFIVPIADATGPGSLQ